MDLEIILTDAPPPEARRVIDQGLIDHAVQQAGFWDSKPLAVLVRYPARNEIVGGLLGRTSLGLLFIDLVFLPEAHRGQGLGSRVLHAAEAEAVRRGCTGAVLYTISFQAPRFYMDHGWQEFGRIPCEPPGTSRIFMTKTLAGQRP